MEGRRGPNTGSVVEGRCGPNTGPCSQLRKSPPLVIPRAKVVRPRSAPDILRNFIPSAHVVASNENALIAFGGSTFLNMGYGFITPFSFKRRGDGLEHGFGD